MDSLDVFRRNFSGGPDRRVSPHGAKAWVCTDGAERSLYLPDEPRYGDKPRVGLGISIPKFGDVRREENYLILIGAEGFPDLAQRMMKADPQVAIRAFGKAMQDVEFPTSDKSRVPELSA